MDSNHENPAESGKKVWKMLSFQLFELRAFVLSLVYSAFKLAKRNWWLIALLTVGSGILGYYRANSWGIVYESESVATFTLGTKKVYGDMIVKLNAIIQQHDSAQIAQLLNIDQGAASSLILVVGTNILGDPLEEDVTQDNSPFKIKLLVNDTRYMDTLEQGIVYYLDSPDYVQERLLFNDVEGKRTISELRTEIDQMEKDRSSILQSGVSQEGLSAIAAALDKARSDLKLAKVHLRFNKNVELMDGFIIAKPAAGYAASRKAFLYGFSGLLLAFLVAMLRERSPQIQSH